MAFESLDTEQRAFAECSTAHGAVAISGVAGSGKTRALLAHLRTVLGKLASPVRVVALTTADPAILATRLAAESDATTITRCEIASIAEFAAICLQAHATTLGLAPGPRILSDRAAKLRFISLAQPLFDLAWPELQNGEIDAEVSGIRFPERFCCALFDFFERLRAADIDPISVVDIAQRGSTTFYAAPPNFADAELVRSTKEIYRDSLRVSAAELARQREREYDLARIAARLADQQATDAQSTGNFSLQAALRFLVLHARRDPAIGAAIRAEYPCGVVDEAQDMSDLERSFLRAIYGETFAGLAFAGDPDQSMRAARRTETRMIFGVTENVFKLQGHYRGSQALWDLQASIASEVPPKNSPSADEFAGAAPPVVYARVGDRAVEARAVATHLRTAIDSGTPPEKCVVVIRSLSCADLYIEALLAQNIPVDLMGHYDPTRETCTADILALFRALADRNDAAAYLRLAASAMLRLSDASIAQLCAAGSDPTLFALAAPARESAPRDPKRVAANMLDGATDHNLGPETVARLTHFRENMQRWSVLAQNPKPAILAQIAAESGILAGDTTHTEFARLMTARLINAIDIQREKLREDEHYSLAMLLTEYRRELQLDTTPGYWSCANTRAVCVADADSLRGYEFDLITIVDARAGAFPRYYVPDAFLFSPARGFIPRENAGAAGPNRTAKFTWYVHAAKAREGYMREERRLFASIVGRVCTQLSVSAAGPATRGITAPEFIDEIRRRKLPGTRDISKNIF